MPSQSAGKSANLSREKHPKPSMSVLWNRVYEKTKTDLRHLRGYGLPPDTTLFRIVQANREKGTLFGDFDHLGHKEQSELIQLVRDIIEGRPPDNYSVMLPILTSPSPLFFRTRGKLPEVEKREWKGPLTEEELDSKMTVIDANARLSDEAAELIADLLLDAAMQEEKHGTGATKRNE